MVDTIPHSHAAAVRSDRTLTDTERSTPYRVNLRGPLVEEELDILQTLYLRTAMVSASVCLTFCQGQTVAIRGETI